MTSVAATSQHFEEKPRMHVIVTGADGALGTAVVRYFVQAGHTVAALIGRRGEPDPTAGRFAAGDLADAENASAAIDSAVRWLGRVDALVHLVGGFHLVETTNSTLADWRAMFDANVASAVACATAVLPHLGEGGTMTLVGARSAEPAAAGFGPYAAAKSGVARLVEALAVELPPRVPFRERCSQ
jgi:NAD(P)-dependent dehydrogenase (short-subunit alcohol dehydrogenase family)